MPASSAGVRGDSELYRSDDQAPAARPQLGTGHQRRRKQVDVNEADALPGQCMPINEAKNFVLTEQRGLRQTV